VIATAPFGALADGRAVRMATLSRPGGLTVEVLDYGAAVRSLRIPGVAGSMVLGFDDIAAYEADTSYQGVAVGRYANRIANGRFTIDGERFQVTTNEGDNCLHGGRLGLSKRLWLFEAVSQTACALVCRSPKGEEGFPGVMEARVELALTDDETLEITWEAQVSRPCPVSLTHHLYFNLSGDPTRSVLDHDLTLRAGAITPVERDLIPTGDLLPVDGTPFDLRAPTRIGDVLERDHPQLAIGGGIDHNWALRPGAGPSIRLRRPETDVSLSITTDQPGVQIYSGQGLAAPFAPFGGLAIEPQEFPDAVNQPGFPDVVLRPGATWRRRAVYRFRSGA
jgi:aldose 1-epimerase